jgi:Protein of unknown function (DUF2796)
MSPGHFMAEPHADLWIGAKTMGATVERLLALCFLAGLAAAPSFAAGEHRELGAHEHGRGTLNIAVEGNKVTMELEAPGVDIVGFEHAAKTSREKAAVEKAKVQLAAPLTLFALPASAACRVTEAKVEVEIGNHDHGAKAKGQPPKSADKGGGKSEGHSEFHVEYALECAAPANLTTIEFGYFRAFAGAQKLDVNVITPKGQNKFEVTRASPRLSLAGMI